MDVEWDILDQQTTYHGNLIRHNLVGGIPTPLKHIISQLGFFFPIYGKIIQMFQTTNQ